MRILILQPWIRVGGAELLSLHLAQELERAGHRVGIAALFVDRAGIDPDLARRTYRLPPRWLQRAFARSRALCVTVGPLALLAVAWRVRHVDLLAPHNLPGPVVAAIVGRARRVPIVWQVNEVPEATLPQDRAAYSAIERVAWRAGSALARAVSRAPDALIVLSEATRAAVRERYGRDAVVVHAGIGVRADGALPKIARRERPLLLFVGKLVPQKDPVRAIRVVQGLADRGIDAELVIVGDGPLRGTVRAELDARLPGRGSLRPRVAPQELRDLYRAAAALIVAADPRQSWGLVPLEALACGTPSVIPGHIGAAEVLGPRQAALIVEHGDDDAFVSAVERLLRDPSLGASLVANGAALVRELTWRRFAEGCLAVFERAVASAGGLRSASDEEDAVGAPPQEPRDLGRPQERRDERADRSENA